MAQEISDLKEIETIKSVPAIFVSAWVVGSEDDRLVRMTLGEGSAVKRSAIRGAYLLSSKDARLLAKLLVEMAARSDQSAKESEAGESEQEGG